MNNVFHVTACASSDQEVMYRGTLLSWDKNRRVTSHL